MAISEAKILTQNPGSARFGGSGELSVQRMRFKLDTSSVYVTGGFDVHLTGLGVVEAASVMREGAIGAVPAVNYQPVVHSIQVGGVGNKVKLQLINPLTGVEVLTGDDVDLAGKHFAVEAEGY